jgi:16S rRNA (uracil1498-N3)-methyltransferase
VKGRLFVTPDADDPDRATLDAPTTRHLRALRLVPGDTLCAIVAPRVERAATVQSLQRDRAVLSLHETLQPQERDPRYARVLAIALGDLARMDVVIEKATELGVTAVQPFVAARSQARSLAPTRGERWERIARSACEQCGRTVAPEIRACIGFEQLLGAVLASEGTTWLLEPSVAAPENADARTVSSQSAMAHSSSVPALAAGDALTIVVGPEGGFDPGEAERLRASGARPLTLGPRVLRFETAAIAALAIALLHAPG